MRNLPVNWSEGMFLRPQHFQAADRYWTEALQTSEKLDLEYNYGLRQLDFSTDAIKNFQFQLNSCQARLKDGTLVTIEPGHEGPERMDLKAPLAEAEHAAVRQAVDLKESFNTAATVRVFLGVPKLKLGAENLAREGRTGAFRFSTRQEPLPDENSPGIDQDIELRSMSVRLLLSTQDRSGYECLPIAEIQRASDQDSTPRLNVFYIPPLLGIDAWPILARDIVRAIYDMVGHKIELLSDQVASRGITLVSQEPGDLDRLMMLTQLNESYSTLSILAFASGVHPFPAYTELCRLVGKLSIFGETRRPPEIPRYDHDDLGRIFYWVKQQIDDLMHKIRDYEYDQRFFVGIDGSGMHVTLDQKWLNADWKWYVGVARENVSERECLELLSPGKIAWKLGSASKVDVLFKTRAEGLQLLHQERAPRALPVVGNWNYFEVTRQGQAWKDVQQDQTLGMRFRDDDVLNRANLEGQRKLILNYQGRQAALQFALFAVPLRA